MFKENKIDEGSLGAYDYELPEELIASTPLGERDASKLLILKRGASKPEHLHFYNLPDLVKENDVLVLNDTKVFSARTFAQRKTGGKFELLFCEISRESSRKNRWVVLVNHVRRLNAGETLTFSDGTETSITKIIGDGFIEVEFAAGFNVVSWLEKGIGTTPLPPYILKKRDKVTEKDKERYQTVFANEFGAVAAPTAGLHFTPQLLQRLTEKGASIAYITLHVGAGTFLPLRNEQLTQNQLHSEFYRISSAAGETINNCKKRGGRIIAVGTTAVRTLEATMSTQGEITPCEGTTELFIMPGFKFQAVDAMITNFHLPRSSLLVLVSAFAGRERIISAYEEAIALNYRFYSYGDATWLEPQ